jgi:type II secretory ATPase GspE/PulE/Tfp pilus assembly ATPase PilB-like protein
MGIEPFLIASTVRAIVGQRLVRKLVPESIETYEPDETTVKRIETAFGVDNLGLPLGGLLENKKILN